MRAINNKSILQRIGAACSHWLIRLVIWTFRIVWNEQLKSYRGYYGTLHPKCGQRIPNTPRIVKVKAWNVALMDARGSRITVTFE